MKNHCKEKRKIHETNIQSSTLFQKVKNYHEKKWTIFIDHSSTFLNTLTLISYLSNLKDEQNALFVQTYLKIENLYRAFASKIRIDKNKNFIECPNYSIEMRL